MKTLLKPVFAAGLLLTASATAMIAAPAAAQQTAPGVGVVSLPAVIVNSDAYRVAEQQRPVTYKPQIDQATARRQQIAAQLQPLYTKLQADQQANVAQATLQQQAIAIQQIEQSGQAELQQITAPIQLSRAYVTEQIEEKLDEAVQAAAAKRGVSLILDASTGQVIYAAASYNMTQDVLSEINTLLPTVQLVPPQGWLPREMRERQAALQAAQAAQQGAAPATTPAQPTGR